jgi:hypothetical protein
MILGPFAVGVAVTALAFLQLMAWAAIGSHFIAKDEDDELALPLSLLFGSGLTAAMLALLTRWGAMSAALGCWIAGCIAALVVQRHRVRLMLRSLIASYATATVEHPWLRIVLIPIALLFWVASIAPPRDADVMRYHLAHVRQILQDGKWVSIPDYVYAMPFGWTLNYLVFERIGLPETAHLLNLGLWLIVLGIALAWLQQNGAGTASVLLALALTLQPFVLKAVTTAHADAYSMFTVFAVALVLSRRPRLRPREMFLLGFAAWIGAQSRYQLVAVGLAVTMLLVVRASRVGIGRREVVSFVMGSALAVALCAPFYVANLLKFGNPVWPLLIGLFNNPPNYADKVSALYQASMTGHYRVGYVAASVASLVRNPLVAPIPLLAGLCAAVYWLDSRARVRVLGAFTALFFAVWVLAEPALYFRFVLFFVPLVILVGGLLIEVLPFRRVSHGVAVFALASVCLAFFGADSLYSLDAARYLVTADRWRYHEATWYYPVYDWANRTTPQNSRFLVIVLSGHTYYLDRPYRRADPWLSGVVDWTAVKTGADLLRVLEVAHYDYIIFDDREWSSMIGGAMMVAAINEAVAQGFVYPVARFNLCLITGRVRGTSMAARVVVLKRRYDASAPSPMYRNGVGDEVRRGSGPTPDTVIAGQHPCGA